MSRIDSSGSIGQQASTVGGSSRDSTSTGLLELDLGDFLGLMIAELQNQDPLNPMENSEILQQISQLRSISSTDKLSNTLDAVLTGQNLTTASGLIGKTVFALSDSGENIRGEVDRVSIEIDEDRGNRRILRVHIGEESVALRNIREILPAGGGEGAFDDLLDQIDAAAVAIAEEEKQPQATTQADVASPPDV